jgi:hypothetical protein
MPTTSVRKILSYTKKEARRGKRLLQKLQGKRFVHLLHIGKTGGSAVKYALRGQRYSDAPGNRYIVSDGYMIALRKHGVTLRDIPEGEAVVFFVRDPISRFVSGFYGRQREDRPRYFVAWTPDEKVAFEHFDTANSLAIALSSADAEERAKAHHAMKSIEHVRSSYWEWFESEEYLRTRLADVFFIGFQERLTEDFAVLKSRLGLPDAVRLPNDETTAHRSPSDLDRALAEEAVENLREWYHADFEFIELCRRLVLEHPALGGSFEERS